MKLSRKIKDSWVYWLLCPIFWFMDIMEEDERRANKGNRYNCPRL